MKRIDEAVELGWKRETLLRFMCPGEALEDTPVYHDTATLIQDEKFNAYGCRGITCDECWNEEIDE